MSYVAEDLGVSEKKSLASSWFENIRNKICSELELIEKEAGSSSVFERTKWDRQGGGGGEISVMYGNVFAKAGVNISTVHGKFADEFAGEIPGTENSTEFWASGVSLVIHPKNPNVPIVHANTRMIVTEKLWFGGGTDLTPVIPFPEDTEFFHNNLNKVCDKYAPTYYPNFKKQCDEYFYIKHRKSPRGIGGIFYDYLNTGNFNNDFNFTKDVGECFLNTYPAIVRRTRDIEFNDSHLQMQRIKRNHYTEFNLIYDRGTRFGLMTNGNIDAILMSLPPECGWR